MKAFIFGGSGYIGSNLLKFFIEKSVFEKYYVLDILQLKGFEKEIEKGLVKYIYIDVKETIQLYSSKIRFSSQLFVLVLLSR